jgi:hypothetical protein
MMISTEVFPEYDRKSDSSLIESLMNIKAQLHLHTSWFGILMLYKKGLDPVSFSEYCLSDSIYEQYFLFYSIVTLVSGYYVLQSLLSQINTFLSVVRIFRFILCALLFLYLQSIPKYGETSIHLKTGILNQLVLGNILVIGLMTVSALAILNQSIVPLCSEDYNICISRKWPCFEGDYPSFPLEPFFGGLLTQILAPLLLKSHHPFAMILGTFILVASTIISAIISDSAISKTSTIYVFCVFQLLAVIEYEKFLLRQYLSHVHVNDAIQKEKSKIILENAEIRQMTGSR